MTPKEIYDQMMEKDAFSHLLGMELVEIGEGWCILRLVITQSMVNGHNIAHGGVTYAISDSALAFASNAYGNKCVSIETNISHLQPIFLQDEIFAKCTELSRGNSIAVYAVNCFNQKEELVSVFKGTVKVSRSTW